MAKRKKKGGIGAGNAAVGAIELAKNWDKIYGTAGASTPPIAGLAAGYGADAAATGAANAFPVGATAVDLGGTVGASALGELIPVLGQAYGIFNLGKQFIQSGTYQNLFNPGKDKMPSEYQRALVGQAADASRDLPGSPVVTPDAEHALPEGWNIPYVNGQYLTPGQIKKLAKGNDIFKNSESPVWLNPSTGQIEDRYTTTTTDGVTTTVDNKTGKMTTENAEGALSTPGVADIINAGGSGVGGTDLGDYETYPTTGGVLGGTTTPSAGEAGGTIGQTGGTNSGVGTAAAGGLAAWLASKGLGGLGNLLGSFNEMPWWAKLALGAGAAGTIGSMVGGNSDTKYDPKPPAKFAGQPATLPQGYAPRTPIAPRTDYYTYGTRPEQSFFSDVPAAATPPATTDRTIQPVDDRTVSAARGGALNLVRSPKSPLDSVSRHVKGKSNGRKDDVDAKLSHGEYVFDAETVAMLGDGNNDAGADKLDQLRANLRKHKGKALAKGKFSPNAKDPMKYMRNV